MVADKMKSHLNLSNQEQVSSVNDALRTQESSGCTGVVDEKLHTPTGKLSHSGQTINRKANSTKESCIVRTSYQAVIGLLLASGVARDTGSHSTAAHRTHRRIPNDGNLFAQPVSTHRLWCDVQTETCIAHRVFKRRHCVCLGFLQLLVQGVQQSFQIRRSLGNVHRRPTHAYCD